MVCPKCGFETEQEMQVCPQCQEVVARVKYKLWHRVAAVAGIFAVIFANIWLLLKIAGRV